jgi:hypothetical protein
VVLIWFVDAQERNSPNYWHYMERFRRRSSIHSYDPTTYHMFEFSEDFLDMDQLNIERGIAKVQDWCQENLSGHYRFDGMAVMIKDPHDIVAFKMRWC